MIKVMNKLGLCPTLFEEPQSVGHKPNLFINLIRA